MIDKNTVYFTNPGMAPVGGMLLFVMDMIAESRPELKNDLNALKTKRIKEFTRYLDEKFPEKAPWGEREAKKLAIDMAECLEGRQ